MAAELELGSELETHLRMFEEGARGLREFDWSAVNAEKLLDGVRRMDRVDQQAPARRSPALSEVKARGLPEEHGCRTAAAFAAAAAELLRGGGWRAVVAGGGSGPGPVAVHR